jgi:hypothetical protein
MTFSGRRHARAAKRIQRDADSLRKAGFTKEADAVQGVADKQRSKIRYKSGKSGRLKRVLGVTLGAAAAAGLAYGGRKLYKSGALDGAISRLNARSAKNLGSYGANRSTNKLKSAYLGAKDRYRNSKLGRRIATEKFKYQNGLSVANRAGEKASLYGRKAKTGVTNVVNRVGDRAALYGNKARRTASNLKNTAKYNYYMGKTKYYVNGGARGVANNAAGKARYAAGYAQGTASRAGRAIANSRVGERAALYGHRVGNAAVRVGERGSLYGHKVRNAASTAGKALNRTAGTRARYAAYTVRDAYKKRKKNRYYRNYNRPIDIR